MLALWSNMARNKGRFSAMPPEKSFLIPGSNAYHRETSERWGYHWQAQAHGAKSFPQEFQRGGVNGAYRVFGSAPSLRASAVSVLPRSSAAINCRLSTYCSRSRCSHRPQAAHSASTTVMANSKVGVVSWPQVPRRGGRFLRLLRFIGLGGFCSLKRWQDFASNDEWQGINRQIILVFAVWVCFLLPISQANSARYLLQRQKLKQDKGYLLRLYDRQTYHLIWKLAVDHVYHDPIWSADHKTVAFGQSRLS